MPLKIIIIIFLIIISSSIIIASLESTTTTTSSSLCPDELNYLKKWSDIKSWENFKLPIKNESINITQPILLDLINLPIFGTIRIFGNGMLVWKQMSGIELKSKSILIYDGGQLIIGSEECKFKFKTKITLIGDSIYNEINQTIIHQDQGNDDHENMEYGQKVIGIGKGGTIELHGQVTKVTWTKLSRNTVFNSRIITVLDYIKDWEIGSEVVLTSTDYDMEQTEVFKIEYCPECKVNQIKLNAIPRYLHWGSQTRQGIDERGEVALLSRNIKIQGELGTTCKNSELVCHFFPWDNFGAHVMVTHGFKNAHFYGVQLFQVGQSHVISRYPIHFHMCGRVDKKGGYDRPAYIQHCSVQKSFSRCYVVHGTDGLLIHDNIGFDSIGHCFMLCDGIEMENTFTNNLGILTKPGLLFPHDRSCEMCTRITPFDFNGNPTKCLECNAVSTFWISNPNNVFSGNVAAGSYFAGYWYIFPDYPSGLSYDRGVKEEIRPFLIAVLNFTNNIAHSCNTGLQIDGAIKVTPPSSKEPQQLNAVITGRYKPRSDPKNFYSNPTPSIFNGATLYKNRWRGCWARGGYLIFKNFKIADNAIGLTLASEGTTPEDPTVGQQVYNSLFVGESDNIGQSSNGIPFINGRSNPFGENGQMPIRGFEVYDGTIYLQGIVFQSFQSLPNRNASAIGFFRVNDWQLSSVTGLKNIKYRQVDKAIHFESTMSDGDKTSTIRDFDGTTTSIANSVLVRNFEFFKTKNCEIKSNWNGLLCKEETRQLFIQNSNTAATKYILPPTSKQQTSILAIRDNDIQQSLELFGTPSNSPSDRFQFLVYKGYVYDFHFPLHPTPPYLSIQPMNWESSEKLLFGICIGSSYGVNIRVAKTIGGTYGNTNDTRDLYPTYSKELVSESTYFLDRTTSILYIMYYQFNKRSNKFNYCPDYGCEEIIIQLSGPNVGRITGDCQTNAYSSSFTLFDEFVNRKFDLPPSLSKSIQYNQKYSYSGIAYLSFTPFKGNEIRFQCKSPGGGGGGGGVVSGGCIPSTGFKYLELWLNGGISYNQRISIQLIINNNNYLSPPYHIEPFNFQRNSWVLLRIPFGDLKNLIPSNKLQSIISFNGLVINSIGYSRNQKTIYLDSIKLIYDN